MQLASECAACNGTILLSAHVVVNLWHQCTWPRFHMQDILEACRQEAAITAERTRLSRQVLMPPCVPCMFLAISHGLVRLAVLHAARESRLILGLKK